MAINHVYYIRIPKCCSRPFPGSLYFQKPKVQHMLGSSHNDKEIGSLRADTPVRCLPAKDFLRLIKKVLHKRVAKINKNPGAKT